jgi:hypothetical protein
MDEQFSRERDEQSRKQAEPTGSSQDHERGQAGAKPDPHGTTTGGAAEGKSRENAAESGPDAARADERTGEGTGARAGEYS